MKNDYSSVYFLKHKTLSPIKIGHSKDSNPYRRVNSYLTYAPFGIDYIGYISIKGKEKSALIEKKIQRFFKDKKINREWFDIDLLELFSYLDNEKYTLIQNKNTIKLDKKEEIINFYKLNKDVKKTSLNFNVSIQYVYRIIKKSQYV
jgi:hypothetical protein